MLAIDPREACNIDMEMFGNTLPPMPQTWLDRPQFYQKWLHDSRVRRVSKQAGAITRLARTDVTRFVGHDDSLTTIDLGMEDAAVISHEREVPEFEAAQTFALTLYADDLGRVEAFDASIHRVYEGYPCELSLPVLAFRSESRQNDLPFNDVMQELSVVRGALKTARYFEPK